MTMDPAIKKRVDYYRGIILLSGHQEFTATFNVPEVADSAICSYFGEWGSYEEDAITKARDCFQLDADNPCHERMLLLILAHVVFGKGKKRGRRKHSGNWDTVKNPD